jgi:hypothetical protein
MTATSVVNWSSCGVDQSTLAARVSAAVAVAVSQVRAAFANWPVHAWATADGSAIVIIEDIELGPRWIQDTTWLAFQISYLHPDADCYPHWVRPDLARANGAALVPPLHNQNQTFDGRPAVMISRRSPRRNPAIDTPARKAQSVVRFLREQA